MTIKQTSLSRHHALSICTLLLLNISLPSQAQTPSPFKQKIQTLGGTFIAAAPAFIKRAIEFTSSNIKKSVGEKLSQFKTMAPKIIIPKLLENLEKLGRNIASISSCMIKGDCSHEKRAAFIATAVIVVALTAALVGLTITAAATSKQVDEQVVQVSQEAQGYGPQALFMRLKNTSEQLRQNILSMKTCLIERACTKTQKHILYATAATIAALATIAVGLGVGSFIYAQYKEKKRAEEAKQEQAGVGEPDKPSADDAGELGSYDDELQPQTPFMERVSKLFKPLKKLPDKVLPPLREAYDMVKKKVQSGVIKASEALKTFEASLKGKWEDFNALIDETFGTKVNDALNKFANLRESFVTFKNTFNEKRKTEMKKIEQKFNTFKDYIDTTTKRINSAINAIGKLSKKRVLFAKLPSVLMIKNLPEQREKVKGKLENNEIAQANIEQEKGVFEIKTNTIYDQLAKNPSSKKVQQQMKQLEKENQKLQAKENRILKEKADLEKELEKIENQIMVRKIISKENLMATYPKIVELARDLDLKQIGSLATNIFATLLGDILKAAQLLHRGAGNIGLTIVNPDINTGLSHFIEAIERFKDYTKRALALDPLITAPNLESIQVVPALLKAVKNRQALQPVKKQIKTLIDDAPNFEKPLNKLADSLNALQKIITTFSSTIKQKFKSEIKESPLINIPKAPIILLKLLGEQIKALQTSFIETVKNSTVLLAIALKLGPPAIKLTKELNNLFESIAKAPFVNPALIDILNEMSGQVLPPLTTGVQLIAPDDFEYMKKFLQPRG